MEDTVKVDEVFNPNPEFKRLYYSYLALGSIAFYLSWAIPVGIWIYLSSEFKTGIAALMLLFLPFYVIISFTAFWIPKFYSSLSYLLTESDIIIERGVWWRHKSIVPYNRVTNIDVVQGPLSRRLGLGKVSIQTAGFSAGGSGGSAKVAEAVIMGTKNFDEVKDLIVSRVKRLRPMAVEAEAEPQIADEVSLKILEELKRIRETLEKKRKS